MRLGIASLLEREHREREPWGGLSSPIDPIPRQYAFPLRRDRASLFDEENIRPRQPRRVSALQDVQYRGEIS